MEKTKRKYSGKIPGRKKRKRTSYTSQPMYMYRGKKENKDISIIMYKIDPLLGTNWESIKNSLFMQGTNWEKHIWGNWEINKFGTNGE